MPNKYEHLANNAIRVAVVGVLAILALFLFAETIAAVQGVATPTAMPANTITVTGQGQAALAPDIAHITFTVQNTAESSALAQAATTKQANAAIAAVEGQGIESADVTTLSYDISPQYSSPTPCVGGMMCPVYVGGGSPRVTGYQVSETVQITVHDLAKVSALLQTLGQQNVQNVSGPDFALSDPNAGQNAARAKAIAAAQAQAQVLAAQLGVDLGRIVSFSDNSGGYPYPVYGLGAKAMSAGAAPAPSPEVPTGENTYTDSVSITYSIR